MTKSARLLADCTLARPASGGCAWCGEPLPKRRRSWCSDRCNDAFWTNHWWSLARRAAKRRDKYRCSLCGHVPPKRPTRRTHASDRAYKAAMSVWRKARKTDRLEVNHREACNGAHGEISCSHHLDNLETLCVDCHKLHTSTLRKTPPVMLSSA